MKSPFLRLVSLFCVMVLLISSCNLPSKTSTEAGGVKKSTTVELTSSGASVELDELAVNLSGSSVSGGSTLTINRVDSEPLQAEQFLAQ